MKRLSTIGKTYMFCILCLVLVFGLTSCAKDEAVKNFNVLASDIKQLQNDISKKVVDSETLLSETNAKDLADPNLPDQLRTEIDSAKNYSIVLPNIASDTDAIKQQIQNITVQKSQLQKYYDTLSSLISEINESKQKLISQIAAEKEAKIQESITPKDTHSITATDSNGNKEKITISIGKWIKGSETKFLDTAWKIVGGTGSMPLTGSFNGDSVLKGGTFHPKDAAYVFGTVTIENMTPDFSAENFANGNSWVYLTPQVQFDGLLSNWHGLEYEGFGSIVQGRQYSSGASCNMISGFNQLIIAKMTSNKWGPAPFVIGVETVFSPNFPEGNPKLNDVYFFLSSYAFAKVEGDTKFQIGKSW